ncbi:MAG: hypothetical protein ACI4GC_01335 [Acutalibacteraceae bacterium]
MKRFSALVLSLIILGTVLMPFSANAQITSYSGLLSVLPGNTRSSSPDYSYAWLDNVIIRHDPMAVTSTSMKPTPEDHAFSHTYDEFIKETSQYETLFYLDENTATAAYEELSTVLFYVVTALGMTDKQEVMRQYLVDYGISLPGNETAEDKMAIAVIYAAIKYDAVYTLYEKEVTFPQGVSLDGAMVIVLSALTNTMLPSGVDTLLGLAVLVMKNYVTQFEQLPVSENPDAEEVFHWAKVVTAAMNDHSVPLAAFDEASAAQKDYVDYAYYASMLETFYDVKINPIYLVVAMQSDDENAIAKLILTSMLDEKKVSYNKSASCEELFNLACKNGYFALENEFYSDVFSYEVEVPTSCEKVWFTPFSLASQLDGGDEKFVKVYLNGTEMALATTVSTALDTSKASETVYLNVVYDNGTDKKEGVIYKFNFVKNDVLDSPDQIVSENDIVAEVEKFVNTIVPSENEALSQKVDEVFSAIDGVASQVKVTVSAALGEGILTTYGVSQPATAVDYQTPETTQKVTERFDFDYLEDLINGVYGVDEDGNLVPTTSKGETSTAKASIIERATAAVKEKPEIVAAPSTLLAVGAFAGYLLSKKHKDMPDEETENDEIEE